MRLLELGTGKCYYTEKNATFYGTVLFLTFFMSSKGISAQGCLRRPRALGKNTNQWHPTAVSLDESHEQRELLGMSGWAVAMWLWA